MLIKKVFLSLAFIPAKKGFRVVFGMHQGLKGDLKCRAVTLHDICWDKKNREDDT